MIDKHFSAKKFDKKSYKDNKKAFKKAKKLFSTLIIKLRKEDFGIDCYVYKSKEDYKIKKPIASVELECKHNWKSKTNFPFNTVNFLAKKDKHVVDHTNPFWILFNEDFSNALIIKMTDIMKYPVKDIYCKGIGYDKIRQIPLHKCAVGLNALEEYILSNI